MKLLAIDGKEIVPARMVPFITSAVPGLDTIPGILSNRLNLSGYPYDPANSRPLSRAGGVVRAILGPEQEVVPLRGDNGLYAYRLDYYDVPVKMLPQEWDKVYTERSTSFSIHRDFGDGIQALWRLEVSKRLPLGVFLWRNDLDLLKINSDAFIKSEYQDFACEGFEHLMQTDPSQLTSVVSTTNNLLGPLVERAFLAIYRETGIFPQYKGILKKLHHMVEVERDEEAVAIIKGFDKVDCVLTVKRSFSVKTIQHWLRDIRKKHRSSPTR